MGWLRHRRAPSAGAGPTATAWCPQPHETRWPLGQCVFALPDDETHFCPYAPSLYGAGAALGLRVRRTRGPQEDEGVWVSGPRRPEWRRVASTAHLGGVGWRPVLDVGGEVLPFVLHHDESTGWLGAWIDGQGGLLPRGPWDEVFVPPRTLVPAGAGSAAGTADAAAPTTPPDPPGAATARRPSPQRASGAAHRRTPARSPGSERCPHCAGLGRTRRTCPGGCSGGQVMQQEYDALTRAMKPRWTRCARCSGSGTLEETCTMCGGAGQFFR